MFGHDPVQDRRTVQDLLDDQELNHKVIYEKPPDGDLIKQVRPNQAASNHLSLDQSKQSGRIAQIGNIAQMGNVMPN